MSDHAQRPQIGQADSVPANWESLDALLLECVSGPGKRGSDLRRVISTADYINKMVYHRHEIEGTFRRLLGSDLVAESGLRFTVTKLGASITSKAPRGSIYDRLSWMSSYLNDNVECIASTSWSLSDAGKSRHVV